MKPLRVLPLAMAGTGLLFVLKVTGLATSGGYVFAPQSTQEVVARMTVRGQVDPAYRPVSVAGAMVLADDIVTGSAGAKEANAAEPKGAAPADAGKLEEKPAPAAGIDLSSSGAVGAVVSVSERALLEKLQQRREELEARNREMDVREGLLRAMEIKLEERVAQLKELENQIQMASPADDAAKAKEEAIKKQLKDLVIMYENMKPKEAARIFDQLDLKVLVSVVMEMNPRKSSEVIAKMTPTSAQRLTVALAAQPVKTASGPIAPENLPKISGQR